MPYFVKQGARLHYEIKTSGLEHDTLFLHGNLASNVWWEPLAKEVGTGGKGRMILAEWRGCGGSQEFSGFDLATLAQDCNDLLAHLSVEKVDLVAHSTGGLIALHAMAAEPERYRKALLLDSVAPEGVQFGPEMRDAFQRMSQDKDFCAAIILSTIHETKLDPALAQKIVDSAFSVSPKIWQGVPDLLEAPPVLDFSRLIHPILVAHGKLDTVLPWEKSQSLAEALPRGKFFLLPNRGHCTNVEDPALLASLLIKFFQFQNETAAPHTGPSLPKLEPETA